MRCILQLETTHGTPRVERTKRNELLAWLDIDNLLDSGKILIWPDSVQWRGRKRGVKQRQESSGVQSAWIQGCSAAPQYQRFQLVCRSGRRGGACSACSAQLQPGQSDTTLISHNYLVRWEPTIQSHHNTSTPELESRIVEIRILQFWVLF